MKRISNSILGVFFLLFNCSVLASETSKELKIHTGFLKEPTYTINSRPENPVYEGTKIHPDLKKLLSTNPQALREAEKAASYKGLNMLGGFIVLGGAVWTLSDTMKQADDVNNGDLSSTNETNWTPLYVMFAGVIVGAVTNSLIKKHWKKSIDIYNGKPNSNKSSQTNSIQLTDRLSMSFSISPNKLHGYRWNIANGVKYVF